MVPLALDDLLRKQIDGFLNSRAPTRQLPQLFQGVDLPGTHLHTHLQAAHIHVEQLNDAELVVISRGYPVRNRPEPPDVVAQFLPIILCQEVELEH